MTRQAKVSAGKTSRFDRVARSPYTRGLPEWDMFPDEATREQAIKAIERGMMPRSILGWLKFLVLCTVLFIMPYVVVSICVDHVLPPFQHADLAKFVAAVVMYTAIVYVLLRRDMPRALRQQLLDAGVPVCMHCGYDLRGLPADRDRCTECGRPFGLRVRELVRHSHLTGADTGNTERND